MQNPLIGKIYPVLKHGFVEVVDLMGDDSAVVEGARASLGDKEKSGKVRSDRDLIRYLMRQEPEHGSPFEMCEIKLKVKIPLYLWGQWKRYRTANINEFSLRYSESVEEFEVPDGNEWRRQGSLHNKQASADIGLDACLGNNLSSLVRSQNVEAYTTYKTLLNHGVAREQARTVLPVSTLTVAIWKNDLRNFLNLLMQRADPKKAQHEWMPYIEALLDIGRQWCPLVLEAWEDYKRNAIRFSRMELEILRDFINTGSESDPTGWMIQRARARFGSGEVTQFRQKLDRMLAEEEV